MNKTGTVNRIYKNCSKIYTEGQSVNVLPSLVLVVRVGVCGGVVVSMGGLFPFVVAVLCVQHSHLRRVALDSSEEFFVLPPGFLYPSHEGSNLLSQPLCFIIVVCV